MEWLNLVKPLVKGRSWIPSQTLQCIAKAIDCFSLPDGKVISMKTILIYIIKHKETKLVPRQKLHLAFMVLEGTLYTTGAKN